MNSLKDINKRRQFLKVTALLLLVLDLIIYCAMETINILYTLKDEEYLHKLILFIVKIIFTIVFIVFLCVMICLRFVNTLLMGAIVYLLFGVILFCYILIEELKSFHSSVEARPIAYYKDGIDTLLISLSLICGLVRTSAGIITILYISFLRLENKRREEEKIKLLEQDLKQDCQVNSLNDPLVDNCNCQDDEIIVHDEVNQDNQV